LQFLRVAHCTKAAVACQSRIHTKPQKGKPYKHPIPSPNQLIDFLTEAGRPQKADAILKAFNLTGQRMRSLLVDKLHAMVRTGRILENRRGEYLLTSKLDLVTGTVSGHRDGFGFVIRDDGEPDDIYLSAREMRPLFNGDRVAIRIKGTDRRGRAEGGLVIPDNPKLAHRILIPRSESGGAKPGQIVVAEILDYPTHVEQATGRITDVIGTPDEKGIATDIAIHSHACSRRSRNTAATYPRRQSKVVSICAALTLSLSMVRTHVTLMMRCIASVAVTDGACSSQLPMYHTT
jgi:ribonuclease R